MSMPEWQNGWPLSHLKGLAAVHKEHDKGLILGAFTGYKERDVAAALGPWETRRESRDAGYEVARAGAHGDAVATVEWARVRQSRAVKDFRGEPMVRMEPGDVQVRRVACLPGFEEQLLSLLADVAAAVPQGGALFLILFVEAPSTAAILAKVPAQRVATKIPASSELIGVYALGRGGRNLGALTLPQRETWGIRRLDLAVPSGTLEAATEELQRVEGWADHYSSYNRGHAWSALALRGYDRDDPHCIVKPAEMSKKWKAENSHMLDRECEATELRDKLPAINRLSQLVPGTPQRVRLMRLEPGGGELTRHADITDPEAGTGRGKVLRIHLPLVTNDDVRFASWDLQGRKVETVMTRGSAWYLDTRKPHTAVNGGQTERIHLVVDTFSTPELIEALHLGGEQR